MIDPATTQLGAQSQKRSARFGRSSDESGGSQTARSPRRRHVPTCGLCEADGGGEEVLAVSPRHCWGVEPWQNRSFALDPKSH